MKDGRDVMIHGFLCSWLGLQLVHPDRAGLAQGVRTRLCLQLDNSRSFTRQAGQGLSYLILLAAASHLKNIISLLLV